MSMTTLIACVAGSVIAICMSLTIQIVRNLRRRRQLSKSKLSRTPRALPTNTRVLAILGSGGHTAEMLALLKDISASKPKITYIVADDASARKVHDSTQVYRVARARHVGEPFWRAIPRAIACVIGSLRVLILVRPNVVLTNGPASGAIVAIMALALNSIFVLNTRVVYLESVARVTSLSLSGRILYPLVHRFLVQWPQLLTFYPNAEYYGRFS